jgi:hypothetical protein
MSQNFCADVDNLFETIALYHIPDNWGRFMDTSTRSLQAVFRHNGNQFSTSTAVHSVHLKEAYENTKTLEKVIFECYSWGVNGGFNDLDLQGAYTKYFCFLWL